MNFKAMTQEFLESKSISLINKILNFDYLNFKIASKKGQEITTDYGRIDFILEDFNKKQLIVELETILDTENKLHYCFDQVLNYKNVSFSDDTEYCILFASETNRKSKLKIEKFGRENDILIRIFSLDLQMKKARLNLNFKYLE